jgi:hypothetical protein
LALRHHFEERFEEKGSQDEIENKNNQDYRHSPEEQFPNLVN